MRMYTSSYNPIAAVVPPLPPTSTTTTTTTTSAVAHQLISANLPSSPLVNGNLNRMNHFTAAPSSNQNHQLNSSGSSSKGMNLIS